MAKKIVRPNAAKVLEEKTVLLSKLKPHPKNYKKHPEDQMAHLVQSVKQLGLYKNIVVAKDMTILAGHGVVEAARRSDLHEIPVRVLDVDPDSPLALKVLANDNELGHFAEVDDFGLADVLKSIKDLDPAGLLGTGYDEMALANLVMVTRPQSEVEDINEAAEWVGMPAMENVPAPLKLIISFENQDHRNKFLQVIKMKQLSKATGKTLSMWWPQRKDEDKKNVAFVADKAKKK